MQEVSTLDLKKRKGIKPSTLFLIAVMVLLFSPFAGIYSISLMAGDVSIQVRMGLDGMELGRYLTEEIYSWHEGLVFPPQHSGWYFVLAFMYKNFDLWGLIAVGIIFNYATAFTILSYIKDKAHPLICAVVIAATCVFQGFPSYNTRPGLASLFFFTFLVVSFMKDRSALFRAVYFAVSCLPLAWLHGGMLPLYMVVYLLLIIIELIYRNFRDAAILLAGSAAGFLLSLLSPMGIGCYTYALTQSSGSAVWAQIQEWLPMEFGIIQIFLVLLVLVGFMTNERIKKFEKKAVTELALLCMFLIVTCVYTRFICFYAVCFLLFAPEQFESLLIWFVRTVVKPAKDLRISLSGGFYRILAAVCIIMTVAHGIIIVPQYLPTGTFADVERMAALDPDAADFLLENGYERVFNPFELGSWLAYRGVKVHIDNRVDPYITGFSGEDYMSEYMDCTTIAEMDAFRNRFDCDAFILYMPDGFSYLLYEVEKYAPDRYRIVYDNVVESPIDEIGSRRFVIIECT